MRAIWRPDIVDVPFIDSGISTLRIDEGSAGAKLKRLMVRGAPADSYIIALDGVSLSAGKCSHPVQQFSLHLSVTVPVINQICDAAIVQPQADCLRVSLIDLKSEKPSFKNAKSQLENSQTFLEYVNRLAQRHLGLPVAVFSRRMIMVAASKSAVGGKSKLRSQEGVGVISIVVNSSGAGRVSFPDLFD